MNDNVSSLYVLYQSLMFVSTLLGPATVLLMMAGAYQVVLKITVFESYCLSTIPAIAYVLLCMFSQSRTQLSVGAILSAVYAIVMTVVLVGTVGTAISGSITSPNVIFMVMLSVTCITSAFMHPRELGCLVPGVLYFICIPAGYLVLTIYFLCNLHVVSWGTREVPKKKTKEEMDREKADAEKKMLRKEERKKGFFGWLGFRYILEEAGEFVKQFRSLLFETNQISEKVQSTKARVRKRSSSHTNDLLQQLIEEFKGSRRTVTHPTEITRDPEIGMETSLKEVSVPVNHDKGMDGPSADRDENILDKGTSEGRQNLQPVIRQDPTRPSWILHPCFGDGPIKLLGERERVFWSQLISRYLHPIVEDNEHQERIRKDLLSLRNNVVFAFFMTSAVWIALFMQLAILQAELKSHLFVHIPRIDEGDALSFQPLGLVFLGCFSIVMLLQFVGMFVHRWGTVLHTLSVTDVGLGQHLKEQVKVRDIILKVSQLQKLRNIEMEPQPDYDEPMPDYVEDGSSVVSAGPQGEQDNQRRHKFQGLPSTAVHQGDKMTRLEDGTPSMPPSYHTQEPSHGLGPRRRGIFHRSGYPHGFALENAFERRFRNEIRNEIRERTVFAGDEPSRGFGRQELLTYPVNDSHMTRVSEYPRNQTSTGHFYTGWQNQGQQQTRPSW